MSGKEEYIITEEQLDLLVDFMNSRFSKDYFFYFEDHKIYVNSYGKKMFGIVLRKKS